MGNLIFAIIIAVIIINSAKRAKGKGSGTSGDSGRRRPAGDTGPLFKGTWQAAETVRKKKTAPRRQTASTEPDEELSTTEYLRQKALEDAREHAEEKQKENLRLYHETGGKMPGQRHLEWEDIPKGMRLVRCNYCGAQNLIPERSSSKNFTCYFCREDL